ncbi:MAG: NfeD family protein [Deltaproteobacteria bacterium]|jgi:membrane protein implicated in regulation of membrane protease activity|nr:NfeD family protein [Deltaproteobacteria bacterium]
MVLFGSEPLFWFALGLFLLILEVTTPGVFFVFFGLGAWTVLLVSLFLPFLPRWAEWALFAAVSVASLVLLRRHLIVFLASRKPPKTDSLSEPMVAERYLGQEVDVIEDIQPGRPGTVEFNGTRWQARCAEALKAGDRARIVDLDGLTFKLEPQEGGAPAPAAAASPAEGISPSGGMASGGE